MTTTTQAQQFISNEMDLLVNIATDKFFIERSVEMAKQLGITPQEWNENKSALLMFFANQVMQIDNKNGNIIREKYTK